jgi:arylsulfatase A-like enzyme
VAYIVHLLIPHHGYLYAGDCTLRDPGHWQRFDKNGGYSAEERTSLYRSYLGQVVCTAMQMDLLFAEMKQLGIYDDATIIVHGDHGSRLGEGPFITAEPEKLHTQDKLDHFSTLLAIKSPDLRPGIRDEPVALQQIFAETFLGGSRSAGRVTGEVFVRTDEESESFGSIQMAWPDADTPVAEQSPPIKPQAAGRRGG